MNRKKFSGTLTRGLTTIPCLLVLAAAAPGVAAWAMSCNETTYFDETYTADPTGPAAETPVGEAEEADTHDATTVTHSSNTDNHTAPSNTHATTTVTHNQWTNYHKTTTVTHSPATDDHQVTTKTIRGGDGTHDGRYYTHTPLSSYHRTGTDTTPWLDGPSWHNPVSDTHYVGTDYHVAATTTHKANTDNHSATTTTHQSNTVNHNAGTDTHYVTTIVHKNNTDFLVPATPGGTPEGMPDFPVSSSLDLPTYDGDPNEEVSNAPYEP